MKRILLVSLTLLIGLSVLVFAGGAREPAESEEVPAETDAPQPPAEPDEIVIAALKGPSGIGMIRLFEEKPDLGADVDTEFQIVGSPDVMVSKILSGEVACAILPTNLAAKLYNGGVPYYLGAVTGNGLLYLLSSDDSVTSLDDLRGREVYNIGQAATPDFILRYLLRERGIDPLNDVTIRFTYNHAELAQNLIAGRVTTGVLPEPFVTMVTTQNRDVRIAVNFQEEWKEVRNTEQSFPMTCVVISKSFLAEHPEAVSRYLDAYRRSIEWVAANPAPAGGLAEKHGIGMKAAVAAQAIPRLNLTFATGEDARELMEPYLEVLLNFDPDSIGGKLPDEGFYTGE
ncbi:MAG: ABC transporter substrate-binding protein [Spirochaetia bacterium]